MVNLMVRFISFVALSVLALRCATGLPNPQTAAVKPPLVATEAGQVDAPQTGVPSAPGASVTDTVIRVSEDCVAAIAGRVTDTRRNPLPGALVTIPALGVSVTTDYAGRFLIPIARPGTYALEARVVGLDQVRLEECRVERGRTQYLVFQLQESSADLSSVTTTLDGSSKRASREDRARADMASEAPSTSPAADASATVARERGDAVSGKTLVGEAGGASSAAALGGAPFDVSAVRQRAAEVKAGAHDDNEEYPMWLEFTDPCQYVRGDRPSLVLHADYRNRVIVRVVDAAGRPAMEVPFRVEEASGRTLWQGRTYASGENVVFPHLFFPEHSDCPSRLIVGWGQNEVRADWTPALDGILTVALPSQRVVPDRLPVDVAFVVDATGSMGDEIDQLRDVLFSIHRRLQNASAKADLRFGMVVYRDRGDAVPLQVIPFTADVDSFEVALAQVRAQGGGDGPEDVQSALAAALDSLNWRADGIRNAFIIADAPPHTDYGQQLDYLCASRQANKCAIRIHMIGASGLPFDGEYIFRQVAVATYGQFIFLTYGEAGESEGRGTASDPGKVSHHTGVNWADRRLDDIVVDLVRRDLAYQVDVPLLASDSPAPSDQQEYLSIRLENLWDQMRRQFTAYSTDTLTAVLLPFENALRDSAALADYLRDLSMELIVKSGTVRLVERDRLEELLREQELTAGGLVDPTHAVELGHLLNSRLVITGRVYQLGTDRVVHVRAIDSETAQIIAAARVRV